MKTWVFNEAMLSIALEQWVLIESEDFSKPPNVADWKRSFVLDFLRSAEAKKLRVAQCEPTPSAQDDQP